MQKQFTHTEFWKENEEDGCDIYIDAIRHFPENVSIVKIVSQVVDSKLYNLLPSQTLWPKIEMSTY